MFPKRSDLFGLITLTAAYWLLSVLGLQWALVGGAGSPVWPAAGVALAGVLLGGVGLWPAILVGRLAAALTIGSQQPLWTELVIAGGNVLAAVLPVLLLRWVVGIDLRLAAMRDVLWLALAAALSAAIAALIGTTILWLSTGFGGEEALVVGSGWWFGNMVGMLTIAPLVLVWWNRQAWDLSRGTGAHLATALLAVAAVSFLLFMQPWVIGLRTWYIFPLLIWVALAFQVRGAAIALTIASGLSIWGAAVGVGPFVGLAAAPAEAVLLSQQFSAITSLTILVLAAVADERRGKEALRTSEERFRLLVNGVRDHALYMLAPSGRVSTWNSGAQRLKGWRSEEVLGQHFSIFFPPEDVSAGKPVLELEQARREGEVVQEGRQLRKDGTSFVAQVTTTALYSDSGALRGFAKIVRDVTEKRQNEERLRRRSEQLQKLAEAALDVARAPTIQVILNKATEAAQSIIGAHQAIASLTQGANWSQALNARALTEKYAASRDFDALPDGLGIYAEVCETNRPMRLTRSELEAHPHWGDFSEHADRHPSMRGSLAVPLVARDGRNLGLIQLSDKQDGSDFDQADEAMLMQLGQIVSASIEQAQTDASVRQLNLELERKVEERTAELVQLQKMETLGRLTGGVAHDFNNLLMAVLSSLEPLKKRWPTGDTEAVRLIDNAMQAAQRGAGLTQRMLAFARRQDLSPAPVDVPELIQGMTDLLRRSLGPQIRLETRFSSDLPQAFMDPNQLELAILNLAVNASHAMPEGGELTIEVDEQVSRKGPSPIRYVRLTFTDTGAGMDEDTLSHATEPFFTTKGVGKGTGLGLPMVLGFIEQSGGKFNLRSEQGRGTTAEMLLPLLASPSSTSEPPDADPASEKRADEPKKLFVLVVDDDALVLMGTASMVEDLGHAVIAAASAQEALSLLAKSPEVDVVVTDQAMPGMTGLQLAAALRAERPHIPVVLATGYADLPQEAGAMPLERLNKPFRQEELAAVLRRVVEQQDDAKVLPLRTSQG